MRRSITAAPPPQFEQDQPRAWHARRWALSMVLLVLVGSRPGRAADKQWTEIRSPHFRVLTDASDSSARRVAREFEQMRVALNDIYPGIRLDSGAPLLVLAPRDEESMKALAPWIWARKGVKPAGFFTHGWDRKYAVVRLDQVSPEAYQVVYHEYVHSIMHLNLRWLPTWLDEGWADFYANTRFEDKRLIVGAPSRRINVVRSRSLIPLETLFKVNQASPYYRDEDKVYMFYAESWGLTHYLTFGEGMERGKKLLQFANLLQQGGDSRKIFEQLFGDIKQMETKLDQYMSRPAMITGILRNPPQTDEKGFVVRKLTEAETEAELGSFHAWQHDTANARTLTEQALRDDPKLGLAHENMGFIDFAAGRDAEAAHEFTEAVAADGKLYLSVFSLAMLSPGAQSNSATDQDRLKDTLLKVLELNPQFAPAYIQLARLYVRQGDLAHALALSRKAEQLEPARAGYHILSGQILERMGRGGEAAAFAKYVADRWTGADHDEAVELWNKVPVGQRPQGDLVPATAPEGTQLVEGKVKSATCGGKDTRESFVIEHEGKLLRFVVKSGFRGGFSDTLWYGEDHFSFCRHGEGLRAVVRYRPSSDNEYNGEVAEFELRDDLPELPAAKSQNDDKKPDAKP